MNAYHVSKNGVPCKLVKIGLHYKGVLAPCAQNEPFHDFGTKINGKRKAERAIKRTIKVATILRSSVISDWKKIEDIISPGQYTLETRKLAAEALCK